MGALSPYRVLDLTTGRVQLTGLLLAGLGADVVLVEPPDGSPARTCGPFAGDRSGPGRSLTFWAENRGKRSVVVDLAEEVGRAQLCDLAAGADVLVDRGRPVRWRPSGWVTTTWRGATRAW
jgi:crotonobetainyl-CoA:carnitine CoA-transferase CaiB-like acyl-CoA transferase